MSRSPESQPPFAFFQGHQYVSLTTFRKNGTPVATPVWFALGDGSLYVYSVASAGKIKRIRGNPKVMLAPCTFMGKPLGPSVESAARILPVVEETAARNALRIKYSWKYRLGDFFSRLRGQKRHYIEIKPV